MLDPTIVLTSNGSTNPYRQLASVKQTTSNAWQGVNSAGVTAALLAEATAASDASPTIGQIQIFPQKFAAWVFGSFEELGDTNFGDQLPGLIGDAKVNISNMGVGRSPSGEAALQVLATDTPVPAELIERLLTVPGVQSARAIDLG